jgi:ADP-ribose pyrophosphatase YjhB (NUDIX family)
MIAYCQNCGIKVETRIIEGRERAVCPACGAIFYQQWKVSAGVRVVKDGKLLLVQRGIDPWRGKWHMPAGYVEVDEGPRMAAEREAREETGLIVRAGKLVDCYLDTQDPRGNVIILLYEAAIIDGSLTLSQETQSVKFFSPDEIHSLPLAGMSSEKEIVDWLNNVQ